MLCGCAAVAGGARQLLPERPRLVLQQRIGRGATKLRRPRRRLHGRSRLPAHRVRGLRCPGAARLHRVALLLVPGRRCAVHESHRRLPAGRIGRVAPGAGVQRLRVERPSLSRRRRHRRGDRSRLCRVPQSHRRGDSPPDRARARRRPVDAVLVRSGVQLRRQARPGPAQPARALPALARSNGSAIANASR